MAELAAAEPGTSPSALARLPEKCGRANTTQCSFSVRRSRCWPPALAACCRTAPSPARITNSLACHFSTRGRKCHSFWTEELHVPRKRLSFYSFWYLWLCSNKTLACGQAGGFNFPCHGFLTVSAMVRLLNDTIWGKHLKGGPQKRTVIIVNVFWADSPPDSLDTCVLLLQQHQGDNLCPGAHIWFCLSSEKKIEIGHLLWKKKNENYNRKYYCCYRRKEDLFLGGKQHQPKLITGSRVRMEMSHLLGVFSGSRVLHSYKAADRTITLSLEGGVSEAAEWALVLFSGDRCLFLLVASKDSAKKKKRWMNCSKF